MSAPFELFSRDALKAGWFLFWRQWPAWVLDVLVSAGISYSVWAQVMATQARSLTEVGWQVFTSMLKAWLVALAILLPIQWFLTNLIAGRWAGRHHGQRLRLWDDGVFWGITWRQTLIGLGVPFLAALLHGLTGGILLVVFLPITSLVSFIVPDRIATLLIDLLFIAPFFVIYLMAGGWAMAIMVEKRLDTRGQAVVQGLGASAAVGAPAGEGPAPIRCPKCGLSETVFGAVSRRWRCNICRYSWQ